MKRSIVQLSLAALLIGGFTVQSCHNKAKDTTTDTSTTTTTGTGIDTMSRTSTAPVTVANDDALKQSVTDATKDYPGVNATVNNGEITLTGNVQRDRLPKLMMALHTLKPKKINDQQLKIK